MRGVVYVCIVVLCTQLRQMCECLCNAGKIMRRILRRVALGGEAMADLGDTSTLADPAVVAALVSGRVETHPKPPRKRHNGGH